MCHDIQRHTTAATSSSAPVRFSHEGDFARVVLSGALKWDQISHRIFLKPKILSWDVLGTKNGAEVRSLTAPRKTSKSWGCGHRYKYILSSAINCIRSNAGKCLWVCFENLLLQVMLQTLCSTQIKRLFECQLPQMSTSWARELDHSKYFEDFSGIWTLASVSNVAIHYHNPCVGLVLHAQIFLGIWTLALICILCSSSHKWFAITLSYSLQGLMSTIVLSSLLWAL